MRSRWLVLLSMWTVLGCGGPQADPTVPTTTASASVAPKATATPAAPVDAGKPADVVSPACAALNQARDKENAVLKDLADSKDPLKHMAALEDSDRTTFTTCHMTKSGGAWGLALADLKLEPSGITAQLVGVHVDSKGQKSTLVLKGASDRIKERSFAVNDHDHTSIMSMQLFDYDGDGEEELVVVGHDQMHEGPRDPISYILTFKNNATISYPPLKDFVFWRVEDNDKDGRLDLITYGPYRSRIAARCNNAIAFAQGPALLLHSLADGSFTMNDATTIAFDKIACDKPGFSVARDEERHVDDEQTFINLACARLWGMSDAQASGLVASACSPISGEATCSDTSTKQCVYPAVMQKWSKATPPLTLH